MNNKREIIKYNISKSNLVYLFKNKKFLVFFHFKHLNCSDLISLKKNLSAFNANMFSCKYSFFKRFFLGYFNASIKFFNGRFLVLYFDKMYEHIDFYNFFINVLKNESKLYPLYIFFNTRFVFLNSFLLTLRKKNLFLELINILNYFSHSILYLSILSSLWIIAILKR